MNDRIRLLISEKGLSASKFAEIIDVQASGISHIISGRNKPGYEFIVKVLENFPDVDPDWLLTGKGGMYRSEGPSVRISQEITDPTLPFANTPNASGNISPSEARNGEMPGTSDQKKPTPSERMEFPVLPPQEAVISTAEKTIESVIIFYTDKSFTSYKPGN